MGLKEMKDAIDQEVEELEIKKKLYAILKELPDDESRRRVMLAVAVLSGVELDQLP